MEKKYIIRLIVAIIGAIAIIISAIFTVNYFQQNNNNSQSVNAGSNVGTTNITFNTLTPSTLTEEKEETDNIPDDEEDDPEETRNRLLLMGLNLWPDNAITANRGLQGNERIINSNGRINETAGFILEDLTNLRGKTLILEFANTSESIFTDDRMVKLEYSDNFIVEPVDVNLIWGYIPAHDTLPNEGIEFLIPNDFAGRLNFVFDQAELNNLRITAWYK